jgi:p-hydroxybenzoate 3-monooxygenase
VPVDESIDAWSDERIWSEMRRRLGDAAGELVDGPILKKEVTPMRSFVAETMQHGRLFLAGDAAHIVPPTGAKGLNLAVGDVVLLAAGFGEALAGDGALLAQYQTLALDRVWKAERFSWWMTQLLHAHPGASHFAGRMQQADLAYLSSSRAAAASFAENYVGLPYAIPLERAAPVLV